MKRLRFVVLALLLTAAACAESGDEPSKKAEAAKSGEAFSAGKNDKAVKIPEGASAGAARADFNGDGVADLAIGEPGAENGKGAVTIVYGSSVGLITSSSSLEAPQRIIGDVAGGGFGKAIAAADFVGTDNQADLAVAVANEVRIFGGAASSTRSRFISSQPSATKRFAGTVKALTWGQFDGRGSADLAVGLPDLPLLGLVRVSETASPCTGLRANTQIERAGAVMVMQSGQGPLSNSSAMIQLGQDRLRAECGEGPPVWFEIGSGNRVGKGDQFGSVLTTLGNRLVIGVPSESFGRFDGFTGNADRKERAGAVHVVSFPTGATNSNVPEGITLRQRITSNGTNFTDGHGTPGVTELRDGFGQSLASKGFCTSGACVELFHTLLIGVPNEVLGSEACPEGGQGVAYSYHVVSDPSGAANIKNVKFGTEFSQAVAAITGTPECGDAFGAAVAVGDFFGRSHPDAVFGVPGEDLDGVSNAGMVHVVKSANPVAGNHFPFLRASFGPSLAGARFGLSLSSWNFGRDGTDPARKFTDLAIGWSGANRCGAATVIYGSDTGLTARDPSEVARGSASSLGGTCTSSDGFASTMY